MQHTMCRFCQRLFDYDREAKLHIWEVPSEGMFFIACPYCQWGWDPDGTTIFQPNLHLGCPISTAVN